MKKVLVLLNAGSEDPSRVASALGLSRVLQNSPDIERVALIFFSNAVELLTDEKYKEMTSQLIADGVFTLACQRHAEQKNIVDELRSGPVPLKYVGEDIVKLLTEDYEIISF